MTLQVRGRKIRSLSDIRTTAGRTDSHSETYKVYLRLAALEMEKTRKQMEYDDARRLIARLDNRFHEIAVEKRMLLESMSTRDESLQELRPSYEKRMAVIQHADEIAAEQARLQQKQQLQQDIEQAEEALRRQDRETEERRRQQSVQSGQGFKLRY